MSDLLPVALDADRGRHGSSRPSRPDSCFTGGRHLSLPWKLPGRLFGVSSFKCSLAWKLTKTLPGNFQGKLILSTSYQKRLPRVTEVSQKVQKTLLFFSGTLRGGSL